MPRPPPIGTRHEIFALSHGACIKATLLLGLVWPERSLIASPKVSLLVWNQGSQQELLERPQPTKNAHSSEWSVKTASRVPLASLRGWGMRVCVGRKTINNRLASRAYRACRILGKPLLTVNHRRCLDWTRRWQNSVRQMSRLCDLHSTCTLVGLLSAISCLGDSAAKLWIHHFG